MQKTNVINGTIGEILCKISRTTDGVEKQSLGEILEKKISIKYPTEKEILRLMLREALKGKIEVKLGNGVLAPDFSAENITTKVKDNHTVIDWNNQ